MINFRCNVAGKLFVFSATLPQDQEAGWRSLLADINHVGEIIRWQMCLGKIRIFSVHFYFIRVQLCREEDDIFRYPGQEEEKFKNVNKLIKRTKAHQRKRFIYGRDKGREITKGWRPDGFSKVGPTRTRCQRGKEKLGKCCRDRQIIYTLEEFHFFPLFFSNFFLSKWEKNIDHSHLGERKQYSIFGYKIFLWTKKNLGDTIYFIFNLITQKKL